jgi:biopolymer transport protein ExbD
MAGALTFLKPRQRRLVAARSVPAERPLVIVAVDGSLSLDGEPVSRAELPSRLAEKMSSRGDREVHFRIDQAVRRDDAVAVMRLAREGGATRYNLVVSR